MNSRTVSGVHGKEHSSAAGSDPSPHQERTNAMMVRGAEGTGGRIQAAMRVWAMVDRLGQPRIASALVFTLALLVRVIYNLTVARGYVPLHDAAQYDFLGHNLLRWHCYCLYAPGHPSTERSPLYPLFLAAVYLVSGYNSLHARLALSVVGSITCVLTAAIARDLFGRRAGLLAGLIAATYSQLFIFDAWMYSESFAICLFTACCFVVMRVVRRPVGWHWLLAGGLLGLVALARPNGIYAWIAVAVWAIVAVRTRMVSLRRGALGVALFTLGCAIVLAPWTLRNYIVTGGAFAPFTTGGGEVIAGAYNDGAYSFPEYQGGWVNALLIPSEAPVFKAFPADCWGPCEVRRNGAGTQLGLHWLATHLRDMPRLLVYRMRQLWTPASPPGEAGMPIWRPFAVLYPTLVLLLAAVGASALLRRWREPIARDALVPVTFAATVVAGALIFYGSPRMRSPMEPLLVVAATGGILWLTRWVAAVASARSFGATKQALVGTSASYCDDGDEQDKGDRRG